jgi:hypothetical protein
MALADIPVWSLPADWKRGCLERLEWLTSVLRSRRGAEQRLGLRLAPRRALEASFVLTGTDRALFDISVHRVGAGEWYVPLYHQGQRLGAGLEAGATAIPVSTAHGGFAAPGAALLWTGPGDFEAVEVEGLDSGGLTLAEPLALPWPAGTRVLPLRRGRLSEQPTLRRLTDAVATAEVRFEITEAEDFPPLVMPTTYGGFPVLETPPDWTEDLSLAYERALVELDNGSGRRHVADSAPDITTTTQQHTWFLHGAAAHAEFYGLLYALQGRHKALWLPSWGADLEPLELDTTGLVVRWCGYTAYGGPREGRQDIRIELRDGTSLYRRIVNTAETEGRDEYLTLNASVGSIAPETVRRISFMALSRLDTDSVEIQHHTDQEGVATASAVFRSAPDLREVEDWNPIPLSGTAKRPFGCIPSACGDPRLFTEFMAFPREGTFPYTPSIGGPNAYFIHKTDQYFRAANFGANWTEDLEAAWAEYLATYFPHYGTPGAIVHDIIEPAAVALVDPGETNAGAELCGFLPLSVFELHYNYSMMPWLTHQWIWNGTVVMLLSGPRTTRPSEVATAEVWTADGNTKLSELTLYFQILPAGSRSLYVSQLAQFGQYGAVEVRPADPPVADPLAFEFITGEGAGDMRESYMIRVFRTYG